MGCSFMPVVTAVLNLRIWQVRMIEFADLASQNGCDGNKFLHR
jgi:hypothetical protein